MAEWLTISAASNNLWSAITNAQTSYSIYTVNDLIMAFYWIDGQFCPV